MAVDGAFRRALGEACAVARGSRSTGVTRFVRRPSPYRTSAQLEVVEVEATDGSVVRVVFKDTSRAAMHLAAQRVKPRRVLDPRREIETYRRVLASRELGTPAWYGGVIDPGQGRYWLFLEHVGGRPLWQVDDPDAWTRVARWLAAAHVAFVRAGVPERAAEVHAMRYDARFYRDWLRRARQLHAGPSCAGSGRRTKLAWLAGRHDAVVDRLLGLPATFVHGDFYPSNVLVERAGDAPRVCAIDWEMAAVGPGLMDLAALTSGRWTDAERLAMADAYRGELGRQGAPQPERDMFLQAWACCRIQIAVQWLGWFGRHRPPVEHAHDWLADAVDLVEELDLP